MDKESLILILLFILALSLGMNFYVRYSPDKLRTPWEQLRAAETDSAIFHRLAEQVGTPKMEYWLYLRNNKLFYCGDFKN